MTKNFILTCPLLVIAFLATGCNRQPTIPDAEFGESVRRVMNSQIHDYEAAIHPNPDAVEGSDPNRLETALQSHREDVANPQAVQQPITISVGDQ
ncbi:MAG: hypothetical protein OEM64_10745 [Gammaproteobacteria bacterium]|nr:hypothetical protein [Gammaproteobacteria bacterium]MDH3416775.1 hypothetical protein [Gammaproteobacteria bacterium]